MTATVTQQGLPPAYNAAQPPPGIATQPQMVTVQSGQPSSGAAIPAGNWNGLKVTGIMQLILGLLSGIFGIVSVGIVTYLSSSGCPIWSGILFFVAGVLGITACAKKNTGLVVGYLITSILASILSASVACVAGTSMIWDTNYCPDRPQYNDFLIPGYSYSRQCRISEGTRVAIDAVLVAVGITEFIVSIIGASLTCSSICSVSPPPQHVVVQYQTYPQQTAMVAGGQPGVAYYQPGAQYVPGQLITTSPQYPQQGQYPVAVQGQPQPVPQGQYPLAPGGQVPPPPQEGQYTPLQPQMPPPAHNTGINYETVK